MFEEIRYEINAVEIDRCKNIGLTSMMKGSASIDAARAHKLENAGWSPVSENPVIADDDAGGNFDVYLPLNMILGFAEDYKKVIVNVKHELILTRARSDLNAIIQEAPAAGQAAEAFKITISKIEWCMPYVHLSDQYKIQQLKYIESNPAIKIPYRSWCMYEYPALPPSRQHVWSVKTSSQMEKPRFVILGFQTNRKLSSLRNASLFDHVNITNARLFLNSQYYPYGNMNVDFTQNQYSILFEMYANFQTEYYKKNSKPLLSRADFKNYMPLIIIDCSKQNESLKNAPVDVRLEFEASAPFPPQTAAYCLIINDRIMEYKPISGEVRKAT
uniref:Double jelly roll-like domain-containing protein n=1 Tax=Trichogramma kaykai TaxID=54128 RepID=A0ABD2WGN9_9HYME